MSGGEIATAAAGVEELNGLATKVSTRNMILVTTVAVRSRLEFGSSD